MKRLLCAAAVLALVAPQVATAQSHNRDQRNDRHQTAKTQHQQRTHQQRSTPTRTREQRTTRTTRVTNNRAARPTVQTRTTRVTHTNVGTYRPGHRPTTYHRIRATTFRYPRGYSYRHWSVGSVLPRLFLSSGYFWNDYAALGLGAPPPGYVWVRYGPDLLLVNRYNGRIADVIPGAFY
jgi:Ni/Co efflux regulator RcnB